MDDDQVNQVSTSFFGKILASDQKILKVFEHRFLFLRSEKCCVDLAIALHGLKMKPVEYLTLDELRRKCLSKTKLPFLKRYPFQPENEVRLLWDSKTEKRQILAVPIELTAISRITLSPWLHPSLAEEVKALLKSIDGCSRLKATPFGKATQIPAPGSNFR